MMNEERLKQILDAEEQAQTLYESAMQEADSLPEQAERRVQDLLEETRQKAELDSARLTEKLSIQQLLMKLSMSMPKEPLI